MYPQPVSEVSPDFGDVFVGSPTSACSNNGRCMLASGTCECFPGFVGEACDRCDEVVGYVLTQTSVAPDSPTFACSRLPQALLQADSVPAAPGMPSIVPSQTSSTDEKKGIGLVVLIVVVVGVVGGFVVIAACFIRRRASNRCKVSVVGAANGDMSTTIGDASPLRQDPLEDVLAAGRALISGKVTPGGDIMPGEEAAAEGEDVIVGMRRLELW